MNFILHRSVKRFALILGLCITGTAAFAVEPPALPTRRTTRSGDTAQQIEALWTYLKDGTLAKKPEGLSRQSYFKRTFQFDAPDAQQPFYFRAASGKTITTQSGRTFAADALQLRITCEHKGIVREVNPCEVSIPLALPKGRSTLTLEYQC